MRKIIAILAVLAMICSVMPALAITDDGNQTSDINTTVTMNGGIAPVGDGEGVYLNVPIIKVMWEYDMDVQLSVSDYGDYASHHQITCFEHDAAPCIPHLQVKPIIDGCTTVGYYVVVAAPLGINPDPNNAGYVDTYVDIWHPDGQFKYQEKLNVVGWNGYEYDKTEALNAWDHVYNNHQSLIQKNENWVTNLDPATTWDKDVYDELNEKLALLYYVEADICCCQPGGHYYVGATAFDTHDNQAAYLYNEFWFIPTSAVQIDFTQVDYSPVARETHKTAGGDKDMSTVKKPTAQNIGNTPITLQVWQDDMHFSQTGGLWNVHYDANLGADGVSVQYDPYETVTIPGSIPLCGTEKLDFGIFVDKASPGVTYTGLMKIWAWIDWSNYIWSTPSNYIGVAPYPIPQQYMGSFDPYGDSLASESN